MRLTVKKPGTQDQKVVFEPPTCQICQSHWKASLQAQGCLQWILGPLVIGGFYAITGLKSFGSWVVFLGLVVLYIVIAQFLIKILIKPGTKAEGHVIGSEPPLSIEVSVQPPAFKVTIRNAKYSALFKQINKLDSKDIVPSK
jgi:hypothetical protein